MDQNLQFLNAIYYVNKEEKDMLVQQLNIINTTLSNINKELTLQNKLSICGNPNFSQDERIKALNDAKAGLSTDLISASILLAYNASLDLLGKNNKNDLTDEIFSRFCVGK